MCMQNNWGKLDRSSKLFLFVCYIRHLVTVTDLNPVGEIGIDLYHNDSEDMVLLQQDRTGIDVVMSIEACQEIPSCTRLITTSK